MPVRERWWSTLSASLFVIVALAVMAVIVLVQAGTAI